MSEYEQMEHPTHPGEGAREPSEEGSEDEAAASTISRHFLPTRILLKHIKPGALNDAIEEGGDTYLVRDANDNDFTVRAPAELVEYNATHELFASSGPGGVHVARKPFGWRACEQGIAGFEKLPQEIKLSFGLLEFDQVDAGAHMAMAPSPSACSREPG
jgi:hypothetical protein